MIIILLAKMVLIDAASRELSIGCHIVKFDDFENSDMWNSGCGAE